VNGRAAVKTRPRRCRTRQDGNGHRETAPPFDRTGAHLREERRRKARSKTESTGASTEAGGWKAEIGRTHLLTTVLQNIRGLVRKQSSWDRVSALVPWTRTAKKIGRMGAMQGFPAFPKKARSWAIHAHKGVGIDTTEGVRDRATVSLSPVIPKHLPVTRVATTGAFSDAPEAE